MTRRICDKLIDRARDCLAGQQLIALIPENLVSLISHAPPIPMAHLRTTDKAIALDLLFGAVNWRFFSLSGEAYVAPEGGPCGSSGLRARMAAAKVDWNDLDSVATLSAELWTAIAGHDLCDNPHRLNSLRGLARALQQQGFSSVSQVITSLPDGAALLATLSATGLFDDPFLKRAQSTTFDVSLRIKARDGAHLPGIEYFTLLPDYRLIQLFLHAGVISVIDPWLDYDLRNRRAYARDALEPLVLRAAVVACSPYLAGAPPIVWDKRLWQLAKMLDMQAAFNYPPMDVDTDEF